MRLVPLLTCLLFAFIAGAAPSPAADTKPNFIVVFCDNLGYGDIQPFGSTIHRTPNLNRMAKEGRKFTHFCVTAGVCTPSRASLITGCYSQRVGMHTNDRDGWVLRPLSPYGLNPDEVTIAEVLKDQGYATAIIGKWHLGDQPEFLPTRQGFDWFFGVPYSDDMTARVWDADGSKWPPLPLMENETVIEAPVDRNGLTKRYTERAMQWIAQHKDEPFFLYFPQAMPGSTSTPFASPEFKGKSKNGPWGDSIEELDWSIGVMLDQLVDLGIAENTLVIWTSDNGAPINPKPGDLSRGSNLPLHGRGYTTGEGAFRVPTIVWQPGKVPGNSVCDQLASTIDLLPTFARLAGGQPPADRIIDGKDIASLLFGKEDAKTPHEAFYYYQQDQLQAIRSGPWKLFLPVKTNRHPHFKKGQKPEPLLFNVVTDIGSKQNVAAEHPDVVARLTQLAQQAREDLGDTDRRGNGQRERGKIAAGTKPQPQVLQQNALQMIESNRGGRHWVDAETAPPKSPQETLKSLQVEPGVEVQLFAAEPLVVDPVAITFDQHGHMYAVEYGDYPIGPPEGGEPLSKIVMLEDTDHDGKADKRYLFADKLNFAHSAMAYQDGLLVGAQTEILYLRDTDGDHVADIREVLFDGFTPAHPQMQIGNPRYGLDNWVHLNYGPGKVTRHATADMPYIDLPLESETKEMPRKEFRFDPQTGEFQADSGLGQFGNTIDRWGNRFYCTNRNPIMTTLISPDDARRNPFHVIAKAHYDVGKSGGETRVYPLVAMKSNYLSHAGTHTSACGTTAYLGDLFSGDFQESVFVCEPIGHLVTRSIIGSDGPLLKATRAREKADFIASSDTWFRPASLASGPDGALYLADMYRLWVEHPKFLPPEIAEKLDWRAGDDRGRIYRIVPKGATTKPYDPPRSTEQLVAFLDDANAWRQTLAQRLLVERRDKNAIPAVRKLLATGQRPTSRLRALWTLDGLGDLQRDDVLRAISDENAYVRRDGVKLATRWIGENDIFNKIAERVEDDDARVRFQVALSLGASDRPDASILLAKVIALRDGRDPWFAQAILSSAKDCSGYILRVLAGDSDFVNEGSEGQVNLIKQLATVVGARGDVDELAGVFAALTDNEADGSWWRSATISGLGTGLSRHRGKLGRTNLPKLLASPPDALAKSAERVKSLLDQNQQVALNGRRSVADRVAAIELLAYQPFASASGSLGTLLAAEQPSAVQAAAINSLSTNGSIDAAKIVLNAWPGLAPSVRGAAVTMLLRRVDSTKLALDAMLDNKLSPAVISIDQRVRLLKHSDAEILAKAKKLLGGAVSSNRQQVASQYRKALELKASAGAGQQVFKRVCANCHKINGEGYTTGPDLSDTRNRSKLALLYDILDPNAKVEPRFTVCTVLTDDGNVFAGLIGSETADAIVLNMAEGKQQTINRDQIDEISIGDVSLMPEGVEKDVSVQQMADLLEFLKPGG